GVAWWATPTLVICSGFIRQVLVDLRLFGVIGRPGSGLANGHGCLLGCDERVALERSPADQLLLIVRSIEVLDGDLDIERFPGRSFLRQPLIEGLALLLLLGRGAEGVAGERAVSLLDHRLQFFSRVLVGVFAALSVPVRRSGILRDTHPQLSSREASAWSIRRARPPRI